MCARARVCMIIVYLDTKFLMPSSNCSLFITITEKPDIDFARPPCRYLRYVNKTCTSHTHLLPHKIL